MILYGFGFRIEDVGFIYKDVNIHGKYCWIRLVNVIFRRGFCLVKLFTGFFCLVSRLCFI